jgi:drug/metabolite transporter (DMT)-like permease
MASVASLSPSRSGWACHAAAEPRTARGYTSAVRTRLLLAFGALYFIWGSTYLAIRIGLEGSPPFMLAASRFALAGSLLTAWALSRGPPRPTRDELRDAAVVGLLLFMGGNASVVWAEQTVASGVVALLVATVPLWLLLMRWAHERVRPTRMEFTGVALGLVGVWVLASPGGAPGAVSLTGLAAMLAGTCAWSAGSLYSRARPRSRAPALTAGLEMLVGAAGLALLSLVRGEPAQFQSSALTVRSVGAVLYLAMFGSVVAFTAYKWLLARVSPTKVGTYAFVNPVVALLLGWAFAGEAVTGRTVLAMGAIVGAVVMITIAHSGDAAEPAVGE